MANLLDMALEGALEGMSTEAFQALVGKNQAFTQIASTAINQAAGNIVSNPVSEMMKSLGEVLVVSAIVDALLGPPSNNNNSNGDNDSNKKPPPPSLDTIEMAEQLQQNSKKEIKNLEKKLGRKITDVKSIPDEIDNIKNAIQQTPHWQLMLPNAIEDIDNAIKEVYVAVQRDNGKKDECWKKAFATALVQEQMLKELIVVRKSLIDNFTACYENFYESIKRNGNDLYRIENAENGESFSVISREKSNGTVYNFPLNKGFDKYTNDEIIELFNKLQQLVSHNQSFENLENTVKRIISALSEHGWCLNKKAESGFRNGDTSESFTFSMKSPSKDIVYFMIYTDGRISSTVQFNNVNNRDHLEFLTGEFRNNLPLDIANRAIVDYK